MQRHAQWQAAVQAEWRYPAAAAVIIPQLLGGASAAYATTAIYAMRVRRRGGEPPFTPPTTVVAIAICRVLKSEEQEAPRRARRAMRSGAQQREISATYCHACWLFITADMAFATFADASRLRAASAPLLAVIVRARGCRDIITNMLFVRHYAEAVMPLLLSLRRDIALELRYAAIDGLYADMIKALMLMLLLRRFFVRHEFGVERRDA